MSQDQLFECATEGDLIKLGQNVGEADHAQASGDAKTTKLLSN